MNSDSLDVEEELEQVKPQFGDVQVFYSSIKKSQVEVENEVEQMANRQYYKS